VDGKYSIDCYLEALEGAYSHLCFNLGIERGKLLEKLDYLVLPHALRQIWRRRRTAT